MSKMREKSQDFRVKYTLGSIKDGYLKLLKTTSKAKISVTLLCSVAKISRATFYHHFQSIDQLETYVNDFYYQRFTSYVLADPLLIYHLTSVKAVLNTALSDPDLFVIFNEGIYTLMVGNIINTFIKHTNEALTKEYQHLSPLVSQMIATYAISGTVSLIVAWFEQLNTYSLDEIAQKIVLFNQTITDLYVRR